MSKIKNAQEVFRLFEGVNKVKVDSFLTVNKSATFQDNSKFT